MFANKSSSELKKKVTKVDFLFDKKINIAYRQAQEPLWCLKKKSKNRMTFLK